MNRKAQVVTEVRPLLRVPHGDRPAGVVARPLRAGHERVEADVPIDPVLRDGLAQVGHDRRPVGNRLFRFPGLEAEAERLHVAVGADAGVLEEVPRAADVGAAFEDDVGAIRAQGLQVVAGANPGYARADDDHIDVLGSHALLRGEEIEVGMSFSFCYDSGPVDRRGRN